MTPNDADEHGRDGAVADEIDRVGEDGEELSPVHGLLDPDEGVNTPASHAQAPPPG